MIDIGYLFFMHTHEILDVSFNLLINARFGNAKFNFIDFKKL